jgi:ribonuclease HII
MGWTFKDIAIMILSIAVIFQLIGLYTINDSKELVSSQLHELISEICDDSQHEYCLRVYPK